jgi:hypothetical protein
MFDARKGALAPHTFPANVQGWCVCLLADQPPIWTWYWAPEESLQVPEPWYGVLIQ